ncbi:hypothetical protein SAY87_015756 [Trapa incisa]|uniref:Uncharacterized protein n=1 Tax=Trapa incisa TaxID=236973 RepID=A0AAN7LDS9_9MYRT|nr:hypothetical protein SAY87_015756 [Trapa incisa]
MTNQNKSSAATYFNCKELQYRNIHICTDVYIECHCYKNDLHTSHQDADPERPELMKGGCVGEGISQLSDSILTTMDICGRSSPEACTQRSAIWRIRDASSSRNLPWRFGSTASHNLPFAYKSQTCITNEMFLM